MNRRGVLLGALLCGAVGWSAWTLLQDDGAVVEATVRPTAGPAATPTPDRGGAARNPGRAAREARAGSNGGHDLPIQQAVPGARFNLFESFGYKPPPAAVSAAPPPPPPRPPALPFAYSGQLIIDGRATFLLVQGDTPISATVGGRIGDFTLVEAVPGNLVFLHVPTGQRVTMPTGSAIN